MSKIMRDTKNRVNTDAPSPKKRDRESADRAGAELEQEQRGDDGGEVRVDDRGERAREALLDRRARRLALAQLFADALEHEHVRIDGHAEGQNDAGDAGQRQRGDRKSTRLNSSHRT